MTAILTDRTTNGAGDWVAHTDPCSVLVPDDSVFDGSWMVIEVSFDQVSKASAGKDAVFYGGGVCNIDVTGDYYLRGVVHNAKSTTSISADSNQV